MIRPSRLVLALALVPSLLAAQDAGPSVTLFSSGRVQVRRTIAAAIANGTTTLPVALGAINASDFAVLEPGVTLQKLVFDPAWSEEALLRRAVGQRFTVRRGLTDTTTMTLLALDPERWSDAMGRVTFGRPGQILWARELVPSAPTADVTVRSDRARQSMKVMYSTNGASWQALYRLYLGANGRVEGNASIMTGPLNLADVEVQLLAGDIGQARPMAAPMPMLAAREAKAYDADMAGASQEAIGEARLYTLPGRTSFTPGTQLVLPLFDPTPAKAERRLTVSGVLPYWGGFGQSGDDEQEVPVDVAYRFDRKLQTPFGDLPLPGGSVQVFDSDKAGRMQLIGAGAIGHTAPGEELLVHTGTAFDVTARRVQNSYSTSQTATTPRRTIATASYTVTLQNAKDSAVTVDVREDRGGEWSVVESSVAPVKKSSSRVVFPVTVPAKGKAVLTYRVRVVW